MTGPHLRRKGEDDGEAAVEREMGFGALNLQVTGFNLAPTPCH